MHIFWSSNQHILPGKERINLGIYSVNRARQNYSYSYPRTSGHLSICYLLNYQYRYKYHQHHYLNLIYNVKRVTSTNSHLKLIDNQSSTLHSALNLKSPHALTDWSDLAITIEYMCLVSILYSIISKQPFILSLTQPCYDTVLRRFYQD